MTALREYPDELRERATCGRQTRAAYACSPPPLLVPVTRALRAPGPPASLHREQRIRRAQAVPQRHPACLLPGPEQPSTAPLERGIRKDPSAVVSFTASVACTSTSSARTRTTTPLSFQRAWKEASSEIRVSGMNSQVCEAGSRASAAPKTVRVWDSSGSPRQRGGGVPRRRRMGSDVSQERDAVDVQPRAQGAALGRDEPLPRGRANHLGLRLRARRLCRRQPTGEGRILDRH